MTGILDEVLGRMEALNVNQSALARECGLSQPHLSRVLNKRLKLAGKTRFKLERWLLNSSVAAPISEEVPPAGDELERLARKLGSMTKERRMQVMQLLRAVEAIVDHA